ncbi:MAG TPA: hypothetical protein VM434_09160 [Beijerinckiaceae bacterium]|nr:hypothetical protein [Beijerinckiaceae bacterium]
MRIFVFRSRSKPDLRAFSAAATGAGLPDKYAPWDAIGVIRPDVSPPHGFSRATIEASIARDSYQLWMLRPTKAAAAKTAG